MKTNTSTENSVKTESAGRGRWLRTAFLTYTLAGPAISAWIKKRASQGSQAVATVAQAIPEVAQSRQADFRERLEELTRESRQRVVEQTQHLRAQASQLQAQSRQLRKVVREEAKQRRKLLAQMRDSSLDWGQDMLKRGEHLTGEMVERGEEVTHDLAKRGRKLAKRSEELLVPAYEQIAYSGRWSASGWVLWWQALSLTGWCVAAPFDRPRKRIRPSNCRRPARGTATLLTLPARFCALTRMERQSQH